MSLSETHVKRGTRVVGVDTVLVEKLGGADPRPCGLRHDVPVGAAVTTMDVPAGSVLARPPRARTCQAGRVSTPGDPPRPVSRFVGRPRRRPPVSFVPGDHVIGTCVPVRVVAWRDARAAVVLCEVVCFPNGFGFTVSAHAREGFPVREPAPRDEASLPETVRVGVAFADGRAVSSDVPGVSTVTGMSEYPGGAGPILTSPGSHGGLWRMDRRYFVWPLPPAGPVGFVFTWPLYEVDRVRVEVDAGELVAAAAQSISLWPQ